MTNSTTLRRHADLVDRMANALGLDLEELMMAGQVQIDTLGDAVLNCSGCTNPEGCEHWLDMQTGAARTAPEICRNVDLFAMLKDGKSV